MSAREWKWPGGRQGAVLFNICLEAWSDGKAPGIGPMGNPLPPHPGVLDTNAISWAEYGAKRGIYHLLEGVEKHGVKGVNVAPPAKNVTTVPFTDQVPLRVSAGVSTRSAVVRR